MIEGNTVGIRCIMPAGRQCVSKESKIKKSVRDPNPRPLSITQLVFQQPFFFARVLCGGKQLRGIPFERVPMSTVAPQLEE